MHKVRTLRWMYHLCTVNNLCAAIVAIKFTDVRLIMRYNVKLAKVTNSASRKRHTGAIPSLVDDKTNIKENLQKLLDVTKNKENSSEEPSEVNDIKEDGKKNDADENEQLRKLHNKVTPPQRTSSSRNGSPHTTRVRISPRARSLSVSSGDDSENEKDTSRAARVHKTEHKDGDLHERSSASGAFSAVTTSAASASGRSSTSRADRETYNEGQLARAKRFISQVIGKLKIVVNKETYEDDIVNEIESIQEKLRRGMTLLTPCVSCYSMLTK